MRVFSVGSPASGGCAELLPFSIDRPLIRICPKCGRRVCEPADHMEAEWQYGSDEIGDFTFAYGHVVVKSQIADELLEHFEGFRKGLIVFPHHASRQEPETRESRARKRIWLPYKGPSLCEMVPTTVVGFDPSTAARIERRCDECGLVIYEWPKGIEEVRGRIRCPREPGKGLFFQRSALGQASFFRPQHTGFVLCTETVKDFMEQKAYTNVEFLEVGDILG
ncbi:MAG: hypothetical protein ACOY3P_24845 [Planctomycetota bacterium]